MQKWRLLSSSRLSYCADWLIVKKTTITLKTKQLNLKIQRSCDHVVSYNTYISSPTWLYPFYSIFLSYWLIQQNDQKIKNLHFRSSRPEVFCEKRVLRNFSKFTGKHLCQSLFFNKAAGAAPLVDASII